MPLLSIITPVHGDAVHLDDTAASVGVVALPPGWEAEWVVQEDADHPNLRERVEALGGVYGVNPKRSGVSATRNLALHRAGGEVAFSLDSDDELLPTGLLLLLPLLDYGDRTWVAGGHVDATGSPDADWSPLRAREWKRGELLAYGTRDWGFHPNNLLARTAALWRVGGWPALPGMEDKLLVVKLNVEGDGASTAIPTVRYRRHGGQTVATESFLSSLPTYHSWVSRYAEVRRES